MSLVRFRERLEGLINGLDRLLTTLASAGFAAVILVNAVEIVQRSLFDYSFYWIQEFTVLLCSYMIFMGTVVIFKRKANIFISFLYDRMGRGVRRIVAVINDILMIIFMTIGIGASWAYMGAVYGGYTQTMKLPMYLMYLPILGSFALIVLVLLQWLLKDLDALRGSPADGGG